MYYIVAVVRIVMSNVVNWLSYELKFYKNLIPTMMSNVVSNL